MCCAIPPYPFINVADVVGHHWSANAAAPQFSWSAALPVLVSLIHLTHHWTVCISTVALPCTWNKHSSHFVPSATTNSITAHCFTEHQSLPFCSRLFHCPVSSETLITQWLWLRMLKDFAHVVVIPIKKCKETKNRRCCFLTVLCI